MELSKRYANFVRVGSDGNVSLYSQFGNRFVYIDDTGNGTGTTNFPQATGGISASIGNFSDLQFIINGNLHTNTLASNIISLRNSSETQTGQLLNSIMAMNGVPSISGSPDLRIGVTAADASPITIFSSTVSGTRYEVKARILATSGSSATYTISWTEGGAARTVALTVTAAGTEYHDNFVIAPDSGTNITAQITSLTSSTVNVDAIVSVLG